MVTGVTPIGSVSMRVRRRCPLTILSVARRKGWTKAFGTDDMTTKKLTWNVVNSFTTLARSIVHGIRTIRKYSKKRGGVLGSTKKLQRKDVSKGRIEKHKT
tara:strand:+ start:127 stop:429 length:303 start_codon:yes stop_codon:yes gene_type:complete